MCCVWQAVSSFVLLAAGIPGSTGALGGAGHALGLLPSPGAGSGLGFSLHLLCLPERSTLIEFWWLLARCQAGNVML